MHSSEVLHRVRGSIDVSMDLVKRARSVYVDAVKAPDPRTLEFFHEAAEALERVVEAVERIPVDASLGPAA